MGKPFPVIAIEDVNDPERAALVRFISWLHKQCR